MNVFEFLQEEDLRKGNKIVQLVKHMDEVPESRKKGVEYWMVQPKYDGCFGMIVKYKGQAKMFGRTGKGLQNCGDLSYQVLNLERLPDGVYIGEVCADVCSLEELSGIIQPNRKKELDEDDNFVKNSLHFPVHDWLSIEEFLEGESTRDAKERIDKVEDIFNLNSDRVYAITTTQCKNLDEARKLANVFISEEMEGAVIKNPDCGWKAGHKGFHAMKFVRGVDYDLECIGYEEGTGKYEGKVANLLFRWRDGKVIKAMLGKGWTHDMAEEMFQIIGASDLGVDDGPVGSIFQVYALQESSKGVLRLPKVGEHRWDKDTPDV